MFGHCRHLMNHIPFHIVPLWICATPKPTMGYGTAQSTLSRICHTKTHQTVALFPENTRNKLTIMKYM